MAGEHRPMTSKQAKASFKKRGSILAPMSDKAKRQIERAAELSDRAAQLREKDKRKKQNALLRGKKDAKQKEQRIAQGLPALPEPKVNASQPRIKGFFANFKARKAAAQARNKEREAAEESEEGDRNSLSQSEDEDLGDSGGAFSENDGHDHDLDQEVLRDVPRSPTTRPTSRKRTYSELIAPSASVPVRRPGDVTDPLVQTNVREIWVPPSQGTIDFDRPRSADSLGTGAFHRFRDKSLDKRRISIPKDPNSLISPIGDRGKQVGAINTEPITGSDPVDQDLNVIAGEVSFRIPSRQCKISRQSTNTPPSLQEPGPCTPGTSASPGSESPISGETRATVMGVVPGYQKIQPLETPANPPQDLEARRKLQPGTTARLLCQGRLDSMNAEEMTRQSANSSPSGEDFAALFPSDSQVFADDFTPMISRTPEDQHNSDFVALLPNDSQALSTHANLTPIPARSGQAQGGVENPPEQPHDEAVTDTFDEFITSSQLVELDIAREEQQNENAAQVAVKVLPHLTTTLEEKTVFSQDLQQLVDGITSSQLIELDEEVEQHTLPALRPKAEQRQPTEVHQEILFSEELDLDPEEADALEAAARTIPETHPVSVHEPQPLQLRSFTTDYGDFDVSTQELRELPL